MAKQNCAVCGKELGLMQQVQMADRNYICRDCEKKTILYFKPLQQTLSEYQANLIQNEQGVKLYEAYFKKNKNMEGFCGGRVLYDPATALICISGTRGGLFNQQKNWNVFRMADVEKYEPAAAIHPGFDKNAPQSIYLSFHVGDGMRGYFIPAQDADIKKLIRAFDAALTGHTGGRFDAFHARKAAHDKNMAGAMAMANMIGGLKDIAVGAMNGGNQEQGIAGAAAVVQSMDALFYAGREDMMNRADEAIRKVLG